MARFVVAALVVFGCQGDRAAAPPDGTLAGAMAAYHAHDHARCIAQGTGYARVARGSRKAEALAVAASCAALAGDRDAAFGLVDQMIAAGMRDVTMIERDPDLAALHDDPRWADKLAGWTRTVAAWERSLAAPALRRELLALVAEDQAARGALTPGPDGMLVGPAGMVEDVDRKTTARMRQVVAERGWPGRSAIGEDGAHGAWLLVQHADADVAFQTECLAKMAPLVATGEVDGTDYAYLTDRVALASGRKQRFGTQFRDDHTPFPIEDLAGVDARRAEVGLPPLADGIAEMVEKYGPP
jgi:hypothetical protein